MRTPRWPLAAVVLLYEAQAGAQAQSPVSTVMTSAISARDALPVAPGSLWRFEGPIHLGAGAHSEGKPPYSGRINQMAVDPTNSNILYATGGTGGVWKTVSGAATTVQWTPLSSGTWPVQAATAVAVDPENPSHVFVGTGDYERLDHVPPFSVGIMRSLDGGLTWSRADTTTNEMSTSTVSRIVVDPRDSRVVLAATGRGAPLPRGNLFVSLDTGGSWTAVGVNANWDDLAVCPGHLFLAAGTRRHNLDDDTDPANNQPAHLFKSSDGSTWTPVKLAGKGFDLATMTAPTPDKMLIACGHNPILGDLVFVAVFVGAQARVFLTNGSPINGVAPGVVWTEATSSPVDLSLGDVAHIFEAPWAHSAFGMTQNRLFLGGVFMASAVLGTLPLSFSLDVPGTHSDFHCAVRDPTTGVDPDTVYLCCDGGVWRWSPTSGASPLNDTLGVTQIDRMDVHPRNGGLIALGTQDFGPMVSFFNNSGWGLVGGCDAAGVAFKGDGSNHVYVADDCGGISRYDGSVLVLLQQNAAGRLPLMYRSSLDLLDYADTSLRELAHPDTTSLAAGATWPPIPIPPNSIPAGDKNAINPSNLDIRALAACPTDQNIIYVGSQIGGLFYSDDGGGTWHAPKTALPPGVENVPVWAISPSPTNCHDILVAFGYEATVGLPPKCVDPTLSCSIRNGSGTLYAGDRLLRNADVTSAAAVWQGAHGGTASNPLLPRAPLFAIARHPVFPDRIWFVGGDAGVFRTDDADTGAGLHWTNATAPLGLPNTLVHDLRLSADGNTLYAGTFGRGAWSMDVMNPLGTFSVLGLVTQGSLPKGGMTVSASGPGQISQFLKNTLTAGTIGTTSPINVTAQAAISGATTTSASLTVQSADAVSLVTASGATLPMSVDPLLSNVFRLTLASAAALEGQPTKGAWSFVVTGAAVTFNGRILFRQIPVVLSGSMNLPFSGTVTTQTGDDGRYALEYLAQGTHQLTAVVNGVSQVKFASPITHATEVNFAVAPVGTFVLAPQFTNGRVHDVSTFTLAYTITDGRSWRDLANVDFVLRDASATILWLRFDTTQGTFALYDPSTAVTGPAFVPGSPNRLETSAATVELSRARVDPKVPDPSSVTLTVPVIFKPQASGRRFDVEVFATDNIGAGEGPELAGSVEVAPFPAR
jgi:hypothetical protein